LISFVPIYNIVDIVDNIDNIVDNIDDKYYHSLDFHISLINQPQQDV